MFFQHKYHHGQSCPGHWVFDGIEWDSGRCLLLEVPDLWAETLKEVSMWDIQPGSQMKSTTGYTLMTLSFISNILWILRSKNSLVFSAFYSLCSSPLPLVIMFNCNKLIYLIYYWFYAIHGIAVYFTLLKWKITLHLFLFLSSFVFSYCIISLAKKKYLWITCMHVADRDSTCNLMSNLVQLIKYLQRQNRLTQNSY